MTKDFNPTEWITTKEAAPLAARNLIDIIDFRSPRASGRGVLPVERE